MKRMGLIVLAVGIAVTGAACFVSEFAQSFGGSMIHLFGIGSFACVFGFLMIFPFSECSYVYEATADYKPSPIKMTAKVLVSVMAVAAALYASYSWFTAANWYELFYNYSVFWAYLPLFPCLVACFFAYIAFMIMAVIVGMMSVAAVVRPFRTVSEGVNSFAIKLSEGTVAFFASLAVPALVYYLGSLICYLIKGESESFISDIGTEVMTPVLCVLFIVNGVLLNLKPTKYTAVIVGAVMFIINLLPYFIGTDETACFSFIKDVQSFRSLPFSLARGICSAAVTYFALAPVIVKKKTASENM